MDKKNNFKNNLKFSRVNTGRKDRAYTLLGLNTENGWIKALALIEIKGNFRVMGRGTQRFSQLQ